MVLVDFMMIWEDGSQAMYQFGNPEMDRTLVIQLGATPRSKPKGMPADGNQDQHFHAAMREIMRLRKQQGRWPVAGCYAARMTTP